MRGRRASSPFRYQQGSTFQAWNFDGPLLGPPDGNCPPAINPFGPANAAGTLNQWLPQFGAATGVQCVAVGGGLSFFVPNDVSEEPKTIWVQVVLHAHGAGTDVDASVTSGAVTHLPTHEINLPVPWLGPGWVHRTWVFCLDVCLREVVDLVVNGPPGGHIDMDQVIIESFCSQCVSPLPPAAPNDYDGDGIPNDKDNAPGVFNPNQLDCDNDGIGNVSDLCICVPGTPLKQEVCGQDTNGGCNSTPPAFEALDCNEVRCGAAWATGGTRDTDWYEFSVDDLDADGQADVRVEVCAALPVIVALVNTSCAQGQVFAADEANPDKLGTFTLCVPAPATYRIFVATGTLAGAIFDGYPCGTANEYTLSLTCLEPCGVLAACGVPGSGDCCTPLGTPGCEDAACCATVCAIDPFCCQVAWDGLCAGQANQFCAGCCPWDLDGDGDVDSYDIRVLRQMYGPCPGCPGDFNSDGVVDGVDLNILRMHLGPCP